MEATTAEGEPRALISRSALTHNAALIRKVVGPSVKICAIIKANAYGHGADIVVDTLTNYTHNNVEPPLVDALAVANIDEALALPETTLPVLIFRPVENAYVGAQREKLEAAIRAGWVLTICSIPAAEDIARIALAVGRRAAVQIMVDTGMTRSGVDCDDLPALWARVLALPSLRLAGVCTHFACSEQRDHPATGQQLACFRKHTDPLLEKTQSRIIRHVANSGAVFLHPQSHLEMVRPGIALYGIDPTCRPNMHRYLRPALRWVAPLLMIRDVAAGTSVGYGYTWTTPRDTRIGLVPVGYADGYLRAFSNRAKVIVNGRPCPVVGRVSMDLITIDLGTSTPAAVGDDVTLIDDDPLSPASIYRLAEIAETIPYELFCQIGRRIPRVAVEPQEAALPAATDAA